LDDQKLEDFHSGNFQIDLSKEEATSPPERHAAVQNAKRLLFLFVGNFAL
jgi:hypothetical protein